jgi:hypothetical protein
MAHVLSGEAGTFLAQAEFVNAETIRDRPSSVPAEAGIYGWWFDAALEEISEGCHSKNGFSLLYVGIAPRTPQKDGVKTRTLRDRLLNHCRGPMATSTLRRTLAALSKEQERLSIQRATSGKSQMSADDEAKLTRWMAKHARVTWLIAPSPWAIEDELLKHGPRLPLNIRGSSDSYRKELTQLRAGSVLPSA